MCNITARMYFSHLDHTCIKIALLWQQPFGACQSLQPGHLYFNVSIRHLFNRLNSRIFSLISDSTIKHSKFEAEMSE